MAPIFFVVSLLFLVKSFHWWPPVLNLTVLSQTEPTTFYEMNFLKSGPVLNQWVVQFCPATGFGFTVPLRSKKHKKIKQKNVLYNQDEWFFIFIVKSNPTPRGPQFPHNYWGYIDFNTVNPNCPKGMILVGCCLNFILSQSTMMASRNICWCCEMFKSRILCATWSRG